MFTKIEIAKKIVEIMTGKLAGKAFKKLERNTRVLKILERLNHETLKEDFDSIYAHALVEYAVDAASPEMLNLFDAKEVRLIFKEGKHNEKHRETADLLFRMLTEGKFKEKLSYLTHVFKGPEDLETEVRLFCQYFDYYTLQTATPFQLENYNKLTALTMQMLRKSFDYQSEQYLTRLTDQFQADYLDKDYYVDLNGETRIPKQDLLRAGEAAGAEKTLEEEEYDIQRHAPLDGFINRWLADKSANFLVLLGEYGTGKTTFLKHMAHQLGARRLDRDPGKAAAIVDEELRLPLFFPLRDFEKTMDSFIVSRFNREGITDIEFAGFKDRLAGSEFVLMLDGFDEMTQKIDADEKSRNFERIRQLIDHSENSKIILTVREEYFRSAAEMREVFKITGKSNYRVVHLQPFDDEQIKIFLKSHTPKPDYYWKQIKTIFDLHDLAKRPVLLQLLVDYLPGLMEVKGENETIDASSLYNSCIADELKRKSDKLKFILPGKYRLEILQRVAVWLFLRDELSFDTGLLERELELSRYFKTDLAWEYEKYLNEFLTFTFLIREPGTDHRYRISHKSFRDYLTARSFVDEINGGHIEHFARNRTTDEINHFIIEQKPDKDALLELVLSARDLPEERRWQGTNAASLLLRIDINILKGRDLSGCRLSLVDFRGCDLTGTNFQNADLSNGKFNKTILSARLKDTNFEGGEVYLNNCGLVDISIAKDFKNLSVLLLDDNKLTDITPIEELTVLTRLDIDNNQLTDITPIEGLNNLRELSLSNNQLTDITPIEGLKNLRYLYISGNPLPPRQIDQLKKALPNCKIVSSESD